MALILNTSDVNINRVGGLETGPPDPLSTSFLKDMQFGKGDGIGYR